MLSLNRTSDCQECQIFVQDASDCAADVGTGSQPVSLNCIEVLPLVSGLWGIVCAKALAPTTRKCADSHLRDEGKS